MDHRVQQPRAQLPLRLNRWPDGARIERVKLSAELRDEIDARGGV